MCCSLLTAFVANSACNTQLLKASPYFSVLSPHLQTFGKHLLYHIVIISSLLTFVIKTGIVLFLPVLVCKALCSLNENIKYRNEIDDRRRQWHPTPALLPGKSHGRRSLVGRSPWGR